MLKRFVMFPISIVGNASPEPIATSSLLVKLVQGLSTAEQAAVIACNCGIETSSHQERDSHGY